MNKSLSCICSIGLLALASQVGAQNYGTGMSPATTENRAAAGADQNSFSDWMGDYSTKNNGYISRKAYMDEAGRRWDTMDKNRQGLTRDQINQMYGYGNTPTDQVKSAPGRAGGANNKGG
jgi:hypothetical protein